MGTIHCGLFSIVDDIGELCKHNWRVQLMNIWLKVCVVIQWA